MKEFNENTRMGFEEFIQSHGSDRNKLQLRCTPYTSKKGGYGSFDLDFGLCVYQHQQSKVDELQALFDQHDQWLGQRNRDVQELYDINIKHAAEKAELQKQVTNLDNRATKYALDAMATAKLNAELRKRVDAALIVAQSIRKEIEHGHLSDDEAKTLASYADDLEQALKGGGK